MLGVVELLVVDVVELPIVGAIELLVVDVVELL